MSSRDQFATDEASESKKNGRPNFFPLDLFFFSLDELSDRGIACLKCRVLAVYQMRFYGQADEVISSITK